CPKITATTGIGRTYGRKTVARWKRQPRSASNSRTDSSSASRTRIGTASSNRALCSSAVWNVGSMTVRLKFSRPTQWPLGSSDGRTSSAIEYPKTNATTANAGAIQTSGSARPRRMRRLRRRGPTEFATSAPGALKRAPPRATLLLVRLRPRREVGDEIAVRATDSRRNLLRRLCGLLRVDLAREQELRLREVRLRVELGRDEVLQIRCAVLHEAEQHLLLRDRDQLRVEAIVRGESAGLLEPRRHALRGVHEHDEVGVDLGVLRPCRDADRLRGRAEPSGVGTVPPLRHRHHADLRHSDLGDELLDVRAGSD